MNEVEAALAATPLFAGLPSGQLETMAGCARAVEAHPGSRLLHVGGPADRFWLVRSGRVAVEIDAVARGPVVLETIGPGDLVGVSWLLPPYVSTFDAVVVDEARLVEFDASCLRGKCEADPVLGYALYRRFAAVLRERLQAARLQLTDVYGPEEAAP